MQISVYEGEILVGTAVLEHLDPPMGVALGPFSPSADYDRNTHANIVEGDYVGDRGRSLTAIIIEHDTPAAATIAIGDYSTFNLGLELTLFFKDGENFGTLFVAHPDYRAY